LAETGPRGRAGGLIRRPGVGDVVAGISVAILLIPQALAYARLAGMPAYIGLYAAALPPLLAAFFASPPYLQTGPVAITSILTYGALSAVAAPGSPEYVQLGALLALVVGVTRVLIGMLKAGNIAFLMSEPVLRGFSTGAALLIIVSQLPSALGVGPGGTGVVGPAIQAVADPSSWSPAALGLTGVTLLLVLGGRAIHPMVPGVPLAAAAGLVGTTLLGLETTIVGEVPAGLPPLSLDLPWRAVPTVLLGGVVIALVGFAEAASVARIFATRERERWNPDRDFVSQGVANLAAALSSGFPVGGSFSRSSLNHLLGARSPWGGAVTGLAVLAFLPFASVLAPLPTAVLSAIVIAAVLGMVQFGRIVALWPLSRPQFAVATVTFGLTLALAPRIDQAVLLGILFATVVHLWREFQVELTSWVEGETLHIRPEGVLWFGSAEVLRTSILDLVVSHPDVQVVRVHFERLGRIDLTGALALELMIEEARAAGLRVVVKGIHPETARALEAVLDRIREIKAAEETAGLVEPDRPGETPTGRRPE